MRPHKLTIENFGPFLNTTVDFDALGNNVFLITGETGSGKTTILDAMIYALYGVASGSGRSKLGTDAFHSDLAKHDGVKETMKVTFSFSDNGKNYEVNRTMNWGKKGDAKTVSKSSSLTENGTSIATGRNDETKDEVTKAIRNILGLDADQFRQIIMLAQGEFKKFLEAKGDERAAILGKIYDNRRQIDLSMRLKAAKDMINKEDSHLKEQEGLYLKQFHFPENITEEERLKITSSGEELPKLLADLIETMAAKQQKLEAEKKNLTRQIESLNGEIKKGETQNKLLEDCTRAIKDHENLLQNQEANDRKKALLQTAKSAQKVLPYENQMANATETLEKTKESILSLTEKQKKAESDVANHKEYLQKLEAQIKPELDQLTASKNLLEQMLPVYKELDQANQDRISKSTRRTQLEAQLRKMTENLALKQDAQKKNKELLASLEHASEADLQNAIAAQNEQAQKGNKLLELNKKITEIHSLEKQVENLASIHRTKQAQALAKEKEHLHLKELFIGGQAGLLAEELRQKLQTEDQVYCMVCGSLHTKADLGHFAPKSEEIPTEDQVDAAYQIFEQARKEEADAKNNRTGKEVELQGRINAVCELSQELLDIADWEALKDQRMVNDKLLEVRDTYNQAKERADKATSDLKAKKNALTQQEQIDKDLELLTEEAKEAENTCNQAITAAETAKTRVEAITKQLQGYPESSEKANLQLRNISLQIKQKNDALEQEKNRQAQMDQDLSETKGNLQQMKNVLEARTKEAENTREQFNEKRQEEGFADQESYRKAMSPEGIYMAPASFNNWIRQTENEVTAFENGLLASKTRKEQLEESTRGMTYTDLNELQTALTGHKSQFSSLDLADRELSQNINNNRNNLEHISRIRQNRAKYIKQLAILEPMATAANSTKKSFDRYVLIDFFQNIVDQANEHFEEMMDNNASLAVSNDVSGNTASELGLKVVDSMGNERFTASLSGGQSFEASMALALGLSEVVQMKSTSSIHIDSMFIDEGFGSLDETRLNKAIKILEGMSDGKRQIGIISHVAKLEERLPKKLRVTQTDKGSIVTVDVDERVH